MKKYIRDFVFYFCLFYLIAVGYNHFFGEKATPVDAPNVIFETKSNDVTAGNLHTFTLENNTKSALHLNDACINADSFKILAPVPNSEPVNVFKAEDCKDVPSITLPAEGKATFTLPVLNKKYFNTEGSYTMSLTFDEGESVESNTFSIEKPGFFRRAFRNLISRPLFNVLVYFTKVFPDHSFGLSIIALTLLVRLLLFIPNQKAMRSQRKMQEVQPKLQALKEKYKDNQQMMAMQTMALYKEYKINPLSSCFPLLLQMPFLLGIYYIVRDGLSTHLDFMLYPSWGNTAADLTNANSLFAWLDLSVIDPYYILPVIVAVAQFAAVKLSIVRKKKQEGKKNKKDQKAATGMAGQAEQMQKMMLYVMPLMIGFFTATFPSGVGIYWLTSTVFGVFQQWFVNKSLEPKKGELKRKNKK